MGNEAGKVDPDLNFILQVFRLQAFMISKQGRGGVGGWWWWDVSVVLQEDSSENSV